MSNYATKFDLKNATGVNSLDFLKKADFSSLKTNVDKLDINKLKYVQSGLTNFKSKLYKLHVDKLVLVPVDLSKRSDVVKLMLLKRVNMMNWLKM